MQPVRSAEGFSMGPNNRQQLRHELTAKRRALSAADLSEAAQRLFALLQTTQLLAGSQRIGIYLAYRGEMGTELIMQALWQQGRACYLPVLDTADPQLMHFCPYRRDDHLSPNRFGIHEPQCSPAERLSPMQLDLVLIPLVAFDRHGNRLGMGQGFYDRAFGFTRQANVATKPRLVGLAHSFQEVAELEAQPWDVPLDAILTEREFIEPLVQPKNSS